MDEAGDWPDTGLHETAPPLTPPHNLELEQAFLGAALTNNTCLDTVRAFLLPNHFFEPVHGDIYSAMLDMTGCGRTADPVKLKPYFDGDDRLSGVGGARYLVRLAASAASLINHGDYAREIVHLACRRQALAIAHAFSRRVATDRGTHTDTGFEDALAGLETGLHALSDVYTASTGPAVQDTPSLLAATLARIEAARNRSLDGSGADLSTGLAGLDACIGGLRRTHLTVVAGRPGMGKSALGLNIALNVARAGHPGNDNPGPTASGDAQGSVRPGERGTSAGCGAPATDRDTATDRGTGRGVGVLVFTPEMSAGECMERALANDISTHDGHTLPYEAIATGRLTAADTARIQAAGTRLADLAIRFVETAGISVVRIRHLAGQQKKRLALKGYALSLIVIDYLGKLGHEDHRLTRYERISRNVASLKDMAKDLDVPVLLLAQLSRQVETREDRRPVLSDLRDSGEIEQEADEVIFLYREEYYLERGKPHPATPDYGDWLTAMDRAAGKIDLIVAKRRGGRTGTATLGANMAACHFTDTASVPPAPAPPSNPAPDTFGM